VLFNSLPFLYAFLPVTYFIFWRLRSKTQRYVWLTITGYVFYATWNYKFCALIAFSTVVSYLAGLGFLRWQSLKVRRLCLILPVSLDLSLLGFFKYINFAIASAHSLGEWWGFSFAPHYLSIILPVGISFYTFHTITYIVDCYRGKIVPTRNFFEFSCYVCLFSQLVAGPIVRFRQIEGDLENIDHANRLAWRARAWSFFVIGMIKKVLVADTLAAMINPALNAQVQVSTITAWLLMLGYTYQLYFDFSGYSDMAVGLGLLFGLRLPQNFDSPYKATSIGDFWHRWHISLSTCLRDYLYIPMGGSRCSPGKIVRNLMVTMLLGGLWHGANWTFVIWGGYHGVLLVVERYCDWLRGLFPAFVNRVVTFVLVVVGWVLFRSVNMRMAAALLHSMFLPTPGPVLPWGWALVAVLMLAAVVAHLTPNTFQLKHAWGVPSTLALGAAFFLCLLVILEGQYSPFLYFQF
jgi:alginate O-acetyltransferase complex protein AlgI